MQGMWMYISSEIIASIIQAFGTVIAAFVAALFAQKIVRKEIRPYFHSYADKNHDLSDITMKAQSDIFIVAAVGDRLLKRYRSELERNLKSGIQVRYLLLDKSGFQKQENYLNGVDVDEQIYNDVLRELKELKEKYPQLLEVRIFHGFLTASYIGVDIWPDPLKGSLPNQVIQVMLYQYLVHAENSPITYLSLETDKEHYTSTVNSIKSMWGASERYK